MTEILAIIPARAGSKRLPGKNIKEFRGAPLLAWTIRCALDSPEITRVVVSTEDAKTAEIARLYGAEVIDRPAHLAGDDASAEDVVCHALGYLAADGYVPDLVMLLQPTSPLRTPADIRGALEKLATGHTGVISHVRDMRGRRRNGAIYATSPDVLMRTGKWGNEAIYSMDLTRSVDIDLQDHWDMAIRMSIRLQLPTPQPVVKPKAKRTTKRRAKK